MVTGAHIPPLPWPNENWVMAVEIPAGPEWVNAFWGVYTQLAKWHSWEREPSRSGVLAAKRWQLAVEETFANWQALGDLNQLVINLDASGQNLAQLLPGTWPPTGGITRYRWGSGGWTISHH